MGVKLFIVLQRLQARVVVGDDEADIKNNLISVNSPIARGLIGKQVDDAVSIQTPKGIVEYEIIEVEYL